MKVVATAKDDNAAGQQNGSQHRYHPVFAVSMSLRDYSRATIAMVNGHNLPDRPTAHRSSQPPTGTSRPVQAGSIMPESSAVSLETKMKKMVEMGFRAEDAEVALKK